MRLIHRIPAAIYLRTAVASLLPAAAPIAAFTPSNASATDLTWDANGADPGETDGGGAWLGASLWWNGSGNVDWTSGAAARFGNGGTGNAITLASPTTVKSLTFNSFGGTFNLGTAGQTITLVEGIILSSTSGAVTLTSPLTLSAHQTWTNNAADGALQLLVNGAVNNNGFDLTIDGSSVAPTRNSANVRIVGALSGAGGLIKSGSGVLWLQSASTHSGPTTVTGGVLRNQVNSLSGLPGGNITLNGGVIEAYWSDNFTRALGTGTNQIQITGGASGFSQHASNTVNVKLGNTNTPIRWGSTHFNPTKLILQETTGATNAHTDFQNALDLDGSDRTVVVKGNAAINARATISGAISNSTGSAGLIKEGAGTLILSVANTYNGGTTIHEGTLQMGNAAALGPTTATLTVNGGLLNLNGQTNVTIGNLAGVGGAIANNASNASILIIGAGNATGGNFQGAIADKTTGTGTVALTKTGTGTITLSGTNTYTGITNIHAGALRIGEGGSSGSLASVEVINNSTLIYDRSDAFSIGYAITGSGALIKQGAGTMTFAVPPIYSGHTTITEGVLKLNHPNTSNDGGFITIAESGATLDLNFLGTETVGELFIGTTRMPFGVYKAIGSPESGTAIAQITGTGTLTVTGDQSSPTLASIADNNTAYALATGTAISYTITFSEPIDSDSLSAEDFENGGTAEIGIGTITETSPGIYTVLVTPTAPGSLQLQIVSGAMVTDPSGNALDTTQPLVDDTRHAVYLSDLGAPQLVGISPLATNVGDTITLTMPEGAKPGDLLVANIAVHASGQYGAVFNSGTGWLAARTGRLAGQENTRLGLYYRFVTEADTGTFQLGLGYDAPFAAAGVVMAFNNVDTAYGPFDGTSAIYSATSPSATAGPTSAISTTTPNTSLLMLGMAIGDQAVSWSNWQTSAPGNLTELYDVNSTGGIKAFSLGAASVEKAATGTTGTGSANLSESTHNGSMLLALRSPYNNALNTALTALKQHVTGEIPLNSTQIANHKQTIQNNRLSFGASGSALVAAFDLVSTYDQVLGPLWVARSLPQRSQLNNDIHHTMFVLMQYLIDYGFSAENLAKHPDLLDGFVFGSSSNFPGACAPPEDPEQTHTALISADYLDTWGRAVFGETSTTPSPKPTGTYLAPGSIATVTVPPSLVGAGYRIRVGAHAADFEDKVAVRRLNRCTVAYPITSTTTKVANPLGGGIYIEVPQYRSGFGVVNVEIKNAVRSPYFSAKSFHRTTLGEWQNVERHHAAPWADFQSEKVMMQVPTSWIYALEDPVTLMADWDRAVDAINDLMGFPRDRGRETLYNQVDLLIKDIAYTPGYPAVNNTYQPGTNYNGYADNYLVRGPRFAPFFEFHELGHGYKFPKFPGEVESDVNLLHVPAMQALGFGIDEAFRTSLPGPGFVTLDNTSIAWMMCDNFLNGVAMPGAEKQYAYKGHAKFVEIARLFGWERVGRYFHSMNADEENNLTVATDVDSLLLRLSTQVNMDIRPLFHFWGVPPINSGALASSVQAANLPSSRLIYDTLVRYKSLIPADNTEFRTFATGWWGREPLDSGYSEERNHASRWAGYDPAMAAATAARAQAIIDLYFPAGRPTDYGDWRSQWDGIDLVDPQADLDGDGMSNEKERIWGLGPNNANSRNPIVNITALDSGKLTYTRRSPSLAGANYSVWTSSNMVDWTEDTGARQSAGAPDGFGVETVEITVSPERLAASSLFVRIQASE